MASLTTTEANRLLDASFGTAAYTAPTTPMKVALATTPSSAAAAGIEVSGGSYIRQTIAFTAASSGAGNTATITFTNMPACTVTHVDIYDSNGTPRRCWWGVLSSPKTFMAGDLFQISVGQIVASLG